jgi:hypothetical protein
MSELFGMALRRDARLAAVSYLLTGAAMGWPQTVLERHGHRLFKDFSARSEVSPDGRWVLRNFSEGSQTLLGLPGGDRNRRNNAGTVDSLNPLRPIESRSASNVTPG